MQFVVPLPHATREAMPVCFYLLVREPKAYRLDSHAFLQPRVTIDLLGCNLPNKSPPPHLWNGSCGHRPPTPGNRAWPGSSAAEPHLHTHTSTPTCSSARPIRKLADWSRCPRRISSGWQYRNITACRLPCPTARVLAVATCALASSNLPAHHRGARSHMGRGWRWGGGGPP